MTNLVKIHGRKRLFKSAAHVQDESEQARRDEWHVPPGRRPGQSAGVRRHKDQDILTSKILRTHDVIMRTTLTLDDDVADFLKEQSRLHNKPFKQVVNEVLRRGMVLGLKEAAPPKFRIVPNHSRLFPGVDPEKLNQFNDQLEAEDFARKSAT